MIEIFAIAFTLLCVLLMSRKHFLSWHIGIIGILLYAIVFFENQLYLSFGLQFIFLTQSILGIFKWNKYRIKNKVISDNLSFKQTYNWIILFLILYSISSILIYFYGNNNLLYIDAIATCGSIIANQMLVYRKGEAWYVWSLVNITYIILFTFIGLYYSIILYVILLFISFNGIKNWNKRKHIILN